MLIGDAGSGSGGSGAGIGSGVGVPKGVGVLQAMKMANQAALKKRLKRAQIQRKKPGGKISRQNLHWLMRQINQ
ncbi:hypothetical protein KRR40_04450 [Niabella defluvii]|nr:hypothetical protein KRR40_04450 [Niabella sp. I65]